MGGRAQCWGQLAHRGGGCCTTFSHVGRSGNRNLFGFWTAPRGRITFKACSQELTSARETTVSGSASSLGPAAGDQMLKYIDRVISYSNNHSCQGCSGLLKAEHHCSRAFQVGTHFRAFKASARPLVAQTFTSPGLFLSVLHSVFVPSSGFCLFVSCLFCGSFFVFITFW